MSHHFLTHSFLRVIAVISFASALCFSQDIKVRGMVKDTSGKAIGNAQVALEYKNKTTKTNSKGEFTFDQNNPVGVNPAVKALQSTGLSAYLKDGVLFLNIVKSGPVEITMYTLHGQAVHKVKKIMDKGTHGIPSAHKGNGVYLYRIKDGDNEMTLKSCSIGGVSAGSSIDRSTIVATAKKAYSFNPPEHLDVLHVKAKGYVDYDIYVNNWDTSYSDIKMLECADTVVDADGNVYQAVRIGDQIWTTSSLKTSKYNDGTEIPNLKDPSAWQFSFTDYKNWSTEEKEKHAGWCYQHKSDEDTTTVGKEWGKLYNWYAAMHSKIAPKGWHVPTREEYYQLRTYLVRNGYNYDGTKYSDWTGQSTDDAMPSAEQSKSKCNKSLAGRIAWMNKEHYRSAGRDSTGEIWCDLRKNNRSGFNALPLGSRWYDGSIHSYEASCYLWCTTECLDPDTQPNGYSFSIQSVNVYFNSNTHETRLGCQIRLVKDK